MDKRRWDFVSQITENWLELELSCKDEIFYPITKLLNWKEKFLALKLAELYAFLLQTSKGHGRLNFLDQTLVQKTKVIYFSSIFKWY